MEPGAPREGDLRSEWEMKEERTFIIDGERISAEVERDGDILRVTVDGQTHTVEIEGGSGQSKIIRSRRGRSGTQNENSGSIVSSIPGKVVSIDVKVGDIVEKGQTILILEAMKMQNEISSPVSGVVADIFVEEGQSVESNFELASISKEAHD